MVYSRRLIVMTILGESIRHTLKKFGKPEKLVKFHLKDPKNLRQCSEDYLDSSRTMKEKIEKTRAPFVLDTGCGWGGFIKKLYTHVRENFEIIGVDIDHISLQYGKTINEAATFLRSQIQTLPFKDEVFDTLLCSGVIHEVKNPKERNKALEEFARVIKPYGQLFIVDAFIVSHIFSLTFVLVFCLLCNMPCKDALEL
jgi:ubiquinone/menaquinone biosynthesis C-methylase UbiE